MSHLIKNKFCIIFLLVIFLVTQQGTVFALSIEEEKKLGDEFVMDVKRHLGVIDDPYLGDFISDLGQYLVKSVETKHFDFRFFVVKSEEINAFAGPGGNIFVYTGLIRAMKEADQLAAVVGHEIAHVSSRHISERIAQSSKLNYASLLGMLAGVLIGGEASGAVMAGTMAAVQQKMLGYSRDAERQADQAGFIITAKSGFDPAAIKEALITLQQGHWGGSEIPPYLLTHPVGPERISNIESMLSNPYVVENRPETEEFRKKYPVFRTIIMAKYEQKEEMFNKFSIDLKKDPDDPLGNLGLGIVLLKDETKYGKAITHLENAVKGLSDPSPVIRYLSEAYELNNQPEKAVSLLQQIIDKNRNDKASLITLMDIYQKIGEDQKAIEILKRLKYLDPNEDRVYYSLGYSYGKLNQLDLAHYNFGIFYQKRKNMSEARFHFQEARKSAKNNKELAEKIDDAMKKLKSEEKDKKEDEKQPLFQLNIHSSQQGYSLN